MNTTGLAARRAVKALIFTMVISLTACHPASPHLSSELDASPRVLRVDPSKVDASAFARAEQSIVEDCRAWSLSPAHAERFFALSDTYHDSPYSSFYQLPCSISGLVEAEGRTWEFTINAGATAIWQSGEAVRYFGCSKQACESLVLLMPDGMNPE